MRQRREKGRLQPGLHGGGLLGRREGPPGAEGGGNRSLAVLGPWVCQGHRTCSGSGRKALGSKDKEVLCSAPRAWWGFLGRNPLRDLGISPPEPGRDDCAVGRGRGGSNHRLRWEPAPQNVTPELIHSGGPCPAGDQAPATGHCLERATAATFLVVMPSMRPVRGIGCLHPKGFPALPSGAPVRDPLGTPTPRGSCYLFSKALISIII